MNERYGLEENLENLVAFVIVNVKNGFYENLLGRFKNFLEGF